MEDQVFRNADELILYLQQLPDEVRYDAQRNAAHQMMSLAMWVDDQVERFYNFVEMDRSWAYHQTRQQFAEEWQALREVVENAQEKRSRVEECRKGVATKWGEANMQIIWHGEPTEYMARNIRTVANKLPFNEMLRRLNRVMLDRVRNPGRGTRSMRFPTPADFLNTIKEDRVYQTVHEPEALANGWRYSSSGLLIGSDEAPQIQPAHPDPITPRAIQTRPEPIPIPAIRGPPSIIPMSQPVPEAHKRTASAASIVTSPTSVRPFHRQSLGSPAQRIPSQHTSILASPHSMKNMMNVISSIDSSLSSAPATLLPDDDIMSIEETEEESIFVNDDRAGAIVKSKKRLKKICTCHDAVTASLRHALNTAKSVTEIHVMSLLSKVTEYHTKNQSLCF